MFGNVRKMSGKLPENLQEMLCNCPENVKETAGKYPKKFPGNVLCQGVPTTEK